MFPVSLFYNFAIPILLSLPPVDVSYGIERLQACLFAKEYGYLTYNSAIKVSTGVDAGTDYPQNHSVYSLHKYALNQSITTGYLIGFGVYRANGSSISQTVVLLYKISPADPLRL